MYVKHNVEFIVDTSCFNDWRDIRTDMNSGMVRSGTKSFMYQIFEGKATSSKDSKYSTHLVKRFVYGHKKECDFHKVIITVKDLKTDKLLPLLYVQYYFDADEHDIEFETFRNGTKTKRSIRQTKFSTRENIKSLGREGLKGKAIYSKLCQSAGSFLNGRSSSDFPNSLRQVHDLVRKDKSASSSGKDELIELIDLCKDTNHQPNAFVREVRTAPELSLVLSSERQLNDICRFASSDHCWCILGVDPTFNICKYNVTVTTYRNPLLYVEGTDISPVMLGPVLIHSHKTFESYYTLPSTMVRLEPKLAKIKAYGTDGEKCVYEA